MGEMADWLLDTALDEIYSGENCGQCGFPIYDAPGCQCKAVELTDTQAAALHTAAVSRFVTSMQLRHAKGDTQKALAAAEAWQSAEMLSVLRRAAQQGEMQWKS